VLKACSHTDADARAAHAPHAEDWGLPGLDLLHEMHFSLGDWTQLAALAEKFREAGAEIQSLTFDRRPEAVMARCRVRGISSSRARSIAFDLAEAGLILAPASVEHLMLARSAR